MEPETETCPLSEVEDIDSLSVSELKARLRSETGERRRASCDRRWRVALDQTLELGARDVGYDTQRGLG